MTNSISPHAEGRSGLIAKRFARFPPAAKGDLVEGVTPAVTLEPGLQRNKN